MALPRSLSKQESQVDKNTPVHNLPPDLIADIFSHVLPSTERETYSYYETLDTLRGVCHLWRGIIDGTSSFWRNIDCMMSEDRLTPPLRNSKEGPLDFKCHCYCYDLGDFLGNNQACLMVPEMDSITPRPIYTGLKTHCRRWESLAIEEGAAAVIRGYLRLPLPSLKRLAIECSQGREVYDEATDGRLFSGERPTLLDLSLERYQLPWDRLSLDELRSFKAEGGWNMPTVTGADVLQLLSRAPLLENLSYKDYGRDDDSQDALPAKFMPPLAPPAIKTLHLTCTSNSFVDMLFRSIVPHPSGVQRINLDLRSACETSDLTFLRAIGRFLDAFPAPADTFKLRLWFDWKCGDRLDFDFGPVYVSFEYGFRGEHADLMLDAIFGECIAEVALERRSAMKSVQLDFLGPLEDFPLKIMGQVNDSFPEVSHFKFSGICIKTLPKALQAISAAQPLLPRLTELDIDTSYYEPMNDGVIEALQECLNARTSIKRWSLGRPLCSDAHCERLQGIVPSGDLNVSDLDKKPRKLAEKEKSLGQPQGLGLDWEAEPTTEWAQLSDW